MVTIKIHIDGNLRKEIKNIYDKDDYATMGAVVNNIVDRYLHTEYFDSELSLENDDKYMICEFCGEKAKRNIVIDIDGKNIEEHKVCENCGSGTPSLE